ncbi:hypothetical protein LCGC14_2035000 [marine sediment metagenome]|uniref:Formyl-CoA transferase n=1 Tax=marine sediment metagenome TaxID=412755 RepID=A0A0F9H711_9ZZZZ|tara:strand:+ start:3312 stop:3536 length:225 start_codon:yes stop_codon:yes gene_type:complete
MTGLAPLAGLNVVELARILAGQWIGQTLADLGAEVIKVEAPEGDDTRRWGTNACIQLPKWRLAWTCLLTACYAQ